METICQGMKIGIKACPNCGKGDRVAIDSNNVFETTLSNHGNALMAIKCKKCDLELTDYTRYTNIRNYAKAAIHIVQRWNRLPRRACHE